MGKRQNHENLMRNHGFRASSDTQFGLTLTTLLSAYSLYLWWSAKGPWATPLIVATFTLLISLLFPYLLRPFNKLWVALGLLLARLTNPIVLGLFFYLILTPLAFIFRRMSQSSMTEKETTASTWVERSARSPIERQF